MTEDRAELVGRLATEMRLRSHTCRDDADKAAMRDFAARLDALPQPVASEDDPVAEMLRWSFIAQAQQTRANKAEQRAEAALGLLRECREPVDWASNVAYSEFSDINLSGLYDHIGARIDALTEAAP